MATMNLTPGAELKVDIAPAYTLTVEVGLAGRPGVGGANLSPDPGNAIEARENGLYVPSVLASTQW